MIKQCTSCKGYGHYSPDCTKPKTVTRHKPRTMEQVCQEAVKRDNAAIFEHELANAKALAEKNDKERSERSERDAEFHLEGLRRRIIDLIGQEEFDRRVEEGHKLFKASLEEEMKKILPGFEVMAIIPIPGHGEPQPPAESMDEFWSRRKKDPRFN